MTREQLEHAIRAARSVSGEAEFVVIGSQAILAQFPDAPPEFRVSEEVDLYPLRHPEKTAEIEGVLGAHSLFHKTHGFYVDTVGPETARLPHGWENRLVRVQSIRTGGAVGLCAEVHDIAASKLAPPARDKDSDFLRALLRHRMASPQTLRRRIMSLPIEREMFPWLTARLEGLVREVELARRAATSAEHVDQAGQRPPPPSSSRRRRDP